MTEPLIEILAKLVLCILFMGLTLAVSAVLRITPYSAGAVLGSCAGGTVAIVLALKFDWPGPVMILAAGGFAFVGGAVWAQQFVDFFPTSDQTEEQQKLK